MGSAKFDTQRCGLRNLKDAEVRKERQIEISESFVALGIQDHYMDMKAVWENIREIVKTVVKEYLHQSELKQHETWFDENSSKLFDTREKFKLLKQSHTNRGNMSL
jgi:hypothetical protein